MLASAQNVNEKCKSEWTMEEKFRKEKKAIYLGYKGKPVITNI